MDVGQKILAVVIAEVSGALLFIFLIMFVANLKESMPSYPLDVSTIVLIWTLYGIGTPIAIFTPVLEMLKELIENIR